MYAHNTPSPSPVTAVEPLLLLFLVLAPRALIAWAGCPMVERGCYGLGGSARHKPHLFNHSQSLGPLDLMFFPSLHKMRGWTTCSLKTPSNSTM